MSPSRQPPNMQPMVVPGGLLVHDIIQEGLIRKVKAIKLGTTTNIQVCRNRPSALSMAGLGCSRG